jgi:predicted unusual protein kinase regulating ubiquinone biosynthesis (AarF/ABC1/UbiB family)
VLKDGTDVVVKVLHDDADRKVLEDLDLMHAVALYLESTIPNWPSTGPPSWWPSSHR